MPKVVDHTSRRAEIAEAVMRIVAERGVTGATVREIAREAGCTTGLLSHYFRDRDELMLLAMRRSMERMKSRLDPASVPETDPRAFLAQLCRATLATDEAGAAAWRVFVHVISYALIDAKLREAMREIMVDARQLISRALRVAADNGVVSDDLDLEAEADALIALADGIGVDAALDPDHYTPDHQRRVVEAYLRRLMP